MRRSAAALLAAQALNASATIEQVAILPAAAAAANPPVNLPERRRRRFRDHLLQQISLAVALPARNEAPVSTAQVAAPNQLKAAACAICRGACCEPGGYHAFLSADLLRRVMDALPRMRPRDVFAAYMNLLPNRTLANSCVFHAQDGCALPRAMRSDVCNQHECGSLVQLGKCQPNSSSLVYLVAMDEPHQPVRTAVYACRETADQAAGANK